MNNLFDIITKILPIILLIVTGNLLRKFKFIKPETISDLKKIIVNLALPAVLFIAFSNTRFNYQYLMIVIVIFVACLLLLLLGILLKKCLKINNRYLPSIFSGFEMGMMGYALFTTVFGTQAIVKAAIVDLGQVLFVFFILVTYVQRQNGDRPSAIATAKSFIKSPVIIAIFVGILCGSFSLGQIIQNNNLTNSVLETLKLLSSLVAPIICLVLGYELHFQWKYFSPSILISLARTGLTFSLAYLINHFILTTLIKSDQMLSIALITMFILPPPFVIPIYMKSDLEEEQQLILNTISVNIVVSLVVYLLLLVGFMR